MDFAALKAELQADPQALGYAQFLPADPVHAAALLNDATVLVDGAPRFSLVKAITAAQALTWTASGPMARIVDASTNAAHPARSSALAFLHGIGSGMSIDMNHADIRAAFDGWQATNVITADEHTALLTLATQPASRADVLGLPAVTASDIVGAL